MSCGWRGSSPSARRSSCTHEVRASSPTARPSHARAISSCLVTTSVARSASAASRVAARGVNLISLSPRHSSPVPGLNRYCAKATWRDVSDSTELRRDSAITCRSLSKRLSHSSCQPSTQRQTTEGRYGVPSLPQVFASDRCILVAGRWCSHCQRRLGARGRTCCLQTGCLCGPYSCVSEWGHPAQGGDLRGRPPADEPCRLFRAVQR